MGRLWNVAATVIQACFRGYLARKAVEKKLRAVAATLMQASVRRHLARKVYESRLRTVAATVMQASVRRHLAVRAAQNRLRAAIKIQSIGRVSPAKRELRKLRKEEKERREAQERKERAERRASTCIQSVARRVQAKRVLRKLRVEAEKNKAATVVQCMVRVAHAKMLFQAMKDAHFRSLVGFTTRLQSLGRRFMAKKQLVMYREVRKQRTKAASKAISQLARDLQVRDTMITLNRERAAAAKERASQNSVYKVATFMESWLIRVVFILTLSTLMARLMPQTAHEFLHNPIALFTPQSSVNGSIFTSFSSSSKMEAKLSSVKFDRKSLKKSTEPSPMQRKARSKPQKESAPYKLLDPQGQERSVVIEPYYFHA